MIIDLSRYPETIQPSYRQLLWNESRMLVLCGGAGSGKSFFCAQKLVFLALSERDSFFVVVRKTSNTHRISTFPLILKIIEELGLTSFIRVNKSDLSIEFIHPFSSKIVFLGLDNPEKIKSLIDMQTIWIEEASEITVNDFNQLNTRLRGRKYRYLQLLISTNPVGGLNHWLYQTFFQKKHPQASVYKSTVYNNQYIDQEYIKTLKIQAELDPLYGKIYLDGDWANAEGLVFNNWTTVGIKQIPKRFDWVCYGVDWGYQDPTSIIKVGCYDKDLYIEELLYQTHLTTNEIIEIFKTNIRPNNKYEDIVCDSAEPDRIQALKNAGLNAFGVKKGPNSIIRSIDILKSRKLYIYDGSTNVINELSSYCWKKDANNKTIEVPNDNFNHSIDAIRYAAMHKLNNEVDPTLPILATGLNVKPK